MKSPEFRVVPETRWMREKTLPVREFPWEPGYKRQQAWKPGPPRSEWSYQKRPGPIQYHLGQNSGQEREQWESVTESTAPIDG